MQYIANLARKTGKDKKMDNSNVQLVINQLNQDIYHEKKKIQKTRTKSRETGNKR
jgi:hypothetical protein